MRLKSILLILGISLSSFFWHSCSEESKVKRKIRSTASKVEFLSPKAGATFNYGDTVLFEIVSKDTSKAIENISLYLNDQLLVEEEGEKFQYTYPSAEGPGGQVRVKAVIHFKDGTSTKKPLGITFKSEKEPQKLSYQLINTYPHDPTSYTQGLIWDPQEEVLFEGTGNYTESRLMKLKLGDEESFYAIDIPDSFFGEGITMMHDTIYQLTYKNKKGFYYDRDFKLLGEFTYPSDGWGLTHDDTHLIMSDGSTNLFFINPHTFKIEKTIQVFGNKGPLYNINELEYVDGIIYANIYTTDMIAKIDAHSGELLALINMEGILKDEFRKGKIDVLNGIAFNPSFGSFYVTGKWWPKLFEVRFVESN